MRTLLKIAKRISNKVLGTTSDLLFWRFRHFIDRRWPENYVSKQSLAHPHRSLLVEKISKYNPQNALEIGCASGPNLILLSRKLPQAKFSGIDLSGSAIQTGKKYLELQKIKNVELRVGNVLNLKNIPDKSFDVVFTDAVLIYVGKNKIKGVLRELARIAKYAVILVEWNSVKDWEYLGHWAYNYETLFKEIAPAAKVTLTKFTEDVWPGEWSKHGGIVEVKF
ncbi:MAG: Methyltransferase type 12 [Candidatus Jorgensenbacteria bacterium GW2011_GWC1_48_8]|uniref:Methyltransferase type 12 n=1 Tax=Candidatus Jorgensenbacteria bacterium GW2011_GWC1_48_8 TaxID=1618666 RepID=A0A0G1UX59_9BACT|nr:MAG: hypothetical protein UW89_C0003G0027 [Parcubacteria group bacterium GW2011_GWB1_45_10]KKU98752.1 MAG: Methyltransferase type 12 [Candidatus Jorgensenbacteria bacterium GW2011_GWC1_48_8]